jgi:hypothetical protein
MCQLAGIALAGQKSVDDSHAGVLAKSLMT